MNKEENQHIYGMCCSCQRFKIIVYEKIAENIINSDSIISFKFKFCQDCMNDITGVVPKIKKTRKIRRKKRKKKGKLLK